MMSDSSDFNYSSDEEPVSKDHKKLLQAVGNLSRVQHIKKVARKEPSANQNEFGLTKPRLELGKRLPVNSTVSVVDLVKTLKGTSQHLSVGKELKNVQSSSKVLSRPLEKPAAERVIRTVNYEKAKKELERWDAVVAQFQSAETQTFPLDSETVYINTGKFKKPLPLSLKSELQIAVETAEAKLRALKGEPEDATAENDDQLEQMLLTKKEIKKRRQELVYLKMRQSQKSAKLRMQNKIKSKKYHRLMKQHKLKEQLKDFELLQKQDPEAALEKLEGLEKNRILERANLRHKNTGTWAKNNLVKAKYNRDVQKDLSEQLMLSRQLTEKKDVSDDDEDTSSDDNARMDPGNESNPWMQANSMKRQVPSNDAVQSGYRKYWMERNKNAEKMTQHQALLVEDPVFVRVAKLTDDSGIKEEETPVYSINPNQKGKRSRKRNKKNKKPDVISIVENGWVVEDVEELDQEANMQSINNLFDKAEEDIIKRLAKQKLKTKKDFTKNAEKHSNKAAARPAKNELKNLEDLKFKTTSLRVDIDEPLLETAKNAEPILPNAAKPTPLPSTERLNQDVIKHDNYAEVKPKVLKTSLTEITDVGEDLDFEEEGIAIDRQTTINDAFEDDDIVAEFCKEKNDDSKKALAEQLTLSMPGWGSWAGTGISQKPNKKLVLQFGKSEDSKTAPGDANSSRVRINDVTNKKLREHLVSDIPFPFTSVKDYEASIRAPIGRSFVPETAFRMLTKPAVITRRGHIIKPMDESELLRPVKRPRSVVEKRILYDAQVAT